MVDVQNDFSPGGALAVPEGDAVVDPINRLMDDVGFVVATRDWHPPDHGSFQAMNGRWPTHCVQDTPGAELHSGLRSEAVDLVVDKGTHRMRAGYSAFDGTNLGQTLREHDVDRVHVAGLALDYCVRATALDASKYGFDVVVHAGATRAIGDANAVLEELRHAGVQVVD